jgi:hypothetical protein
MASKLKAWFAYRVAESIRWNTVSAALLIPGGALATFLTYWIVWGMVALGLGRLFDLSWTTIHVMAAVFIVAIFVWQFTAGRYFEETYALTRDEHAEQKVAMSRAVGGGMALLLDMQVASMFIRVVTLMFLMGPRMLGASVKLWLRVKRLKQMDVAASGRVVAFLLKAQGRVDIEDIAQRFPDSDVVKIVQPLEDFDGVVFMQQDGSVALTLAPRLVEDFEGWTTAD